MEEVSGFFDDSEYQRFEEDDSGDESNSIYEEYRCFEEDDSGDESFSIHEDHTSTEIMVDSIELQKMDEESIKKLPEFDPLIDLIDYECEICARCKYTKYKCPGHRSKLTLEVPIFHPYYGVPLAIKALKFLGLKNLKTRISQTGIKTIFENYLELTPEMYIDKINHLDFTWWIKHDWKDLMPKSAVFFQLIVLPKNFRNNETKKIKHASNKLNLAIMDKLTRLYLNIYRCNEKIKSSMKKKCINKHNLDVLLNGNYGLNKLVRELLMSNNNTDNDNENSIIHIISGKRGLLRSTILSKRCDFTAKAVIRGDPALKLDELGIPEEIAKTLSIPETVTNANKERLQGLVKRGPNNYPGAIYIIKDDKIYSLVKLNKSKNVLLKEGDIVERHLQNGDILVVNRPPTLHKFGFLSHKVCITVGATFSLNVSSVSPYGADFDGDVMYIHVPQTPAAIAESSILLAHKHNMTSPIDGNMIFGLIQDNLTGLFMLTSDTNFFTKKQSQELTHKDLPIPTILYPVQMWTGKQIISLILPNITCDPNLTTMPYDLGGLLIHNGNIIRGNINKKSCYYILKKTHVIFGPERCYQLIHDFQLLINNYLYRLSPITFSGADLHEDEILSTILNSFSEKLNKCENETKLLKKRTFTEEIGSMVLEHFPYSNNLIKMARAGSKGKKSNLSKIMAGLGQQYVKGTIIEPRYDNERILPTIECSDKNHPEYLGFVSSSFVKGLNQSEYYLNSMASADSASQKSMVTPTIGHMHRNVTKHLEDITVRWDKSIRAANNKIIQFTYGGGHFASELLVDVKVCFYRNISSLLSFIGSELYKNHAKLDCIEELEEIINITKTIDSLYEGAYNEKNSIIIKMPFDIIDLLQNLSNFGQCTEKASATEIIELTKAFFLHKFCIKNEEINNKCFNLTKLYLRENLLSATLVTKYKFSLEQLNSLLESINERLMDARIPAGDAVGICTSQSIFESLTQSSLSAVHSAGLKDSSIDASIKTIKQLLYLPKNYVEKGIADKVREIELSFGIDAALGFLNEKLKEFFVDQNINMDSSHIDLVTDFMGREGILFPLSNKSVRGESQFKRAANEEAFKKLMENESEDPCLGVSENIVFNKTVRTGTGTVTLCNMLDGIKYFTSDQGSNADEFLSPHEEIAQSDNTWIKLKAKIHLRNTSFYNAKKNNIKNYLQNCVKKIIKSSNYVVDVPLTILENGEKNKNWSPVEHKKVKVKKLYFGDAKDKGNIEVLPLDIKSDITTFFIWYWAYVSVL